MSELSEIDLDIQDIEKYAEEFELDFTENEINNFDLDKSDFSDFSDTDYVPDAEHESTSSSLESDTDNSFESDDDTPLAKIAGRGKTTRRGLNNNLRMGYRTGRKIRSDNRGRGRGRQTRGRRGRERRVRDGSNIISIDATDTALDHWSVSEEFTPKTVVPFMEPAYLRLATDGFNEYDYFKQYIDDELVNLVVKHSNEHFDISHDKALGLTISEFYIFLGASLAMASINYPKLRMFWEKDYKIRIIADNISRDRFLFLRNRIKLVADKDVPPEIRRTDKLWKVRPIIDKIKNKCKSLVKEQPLCIDEMIVPFTGGCPIRQYCPGKPNPTGLKIFVLAKPNGLICDFDVYQGDTTYPNYANTKFTLGEKAVLNLTDHLIPGHILYFDRYFTTANLLKELSNRNLMGAGTLMKNRIPKQARPLLKSDGDLNREGRGATHMVVSSDDSLALTKWLDNKPILLMSNVHAVEPKDICKRWSKNLKAYIHVPRPYVIKAYNTNMGGVDLADRLLAVCPNRYRTRKWTQRFISHMIDLAITNAWIQYRQDKIARNTPVKDILQLRDFKMAVATTMLEAYADTSSGCETDSDNDRLNVEHCKRRGRKPVVPTPSIQVRTRKANHLPDFANTQNKCRVCHKKTMMKCSCCNVHLCIVRDRNCFKVFHT